MTTLGRILPSQAVGLLPNVLCDQWARGSVSSSHYHHRYLKYSTGVPCNYVGGCAQAENQHRRRIYWCHVLRPAITCLLTKRKEKQLPKPHQSRYTSCLAMGDDLNEFRSSLSLTALSTSEPNASPTGSRTCLDMRS